MAHQVKTLAQSPTTWVWSPRSHIIEREPIPSSCLSMFTCVPWQRHTHTEANTHTHTCKGTHTLLMLTQFSFHSCQAIISAHKSWSDNTGKAGYQSRCRVRKPLGVMAYTELLTLGCPQGGRVYVRNWTELSGLMKPSSSSQTSKISAGTTGQL